MAASFRFAFDRFELDPERRFLNASGERVAISDRHVEVLLLLVARAGQIVSKDDLIAAGWKDVAVSDNSLEQAISNLRRVLGDGYIETIARRGYRFNVIVERRRPRETDAGLDALLAPHRAFIEGRAALETLEAGQAAKARAVFERAVASAPEHPSSHVGLANACVMQFEMTRADAAPDGVALATAARHARDACRLDPDFGEAWATLAFVLDRSGDRLDAQAAAQRAVTLEPDNWRHHFRRSFIGWGEERLRAAHRTLALVPDFPLAQWLAATVHVARQAFGEAERDLVAGLKSQSAAASGAPHFSAVALHWLLGLLHLARGDERAALEEFEAELSGEHRGHLYARECAANTWYAIGAVHLHAGRASDAEAAFNQAIRRVARHPMARVALDAHVGRQIDPSLPVASVDGALAQAAALSLAGRHTDAALAVDAMLAQAPPGNAAWLLPIEPLLRVSDHAETWAPVLARLRSRAF